MHDHVGKDVCDILMDVTTSGTTTVLVKVPHLGGALVELLYDLDRKMFTIKFKAFVCVIFAKQNKFISLLADIDEPITNPKQQWTLLSHLLTILSM